MLLAVDIGNTHITLGLFRREGGRLLKKTSAVWRLSSQGHRTEDEYAVEILGLLRQSNLKADAIGGVAVASVVPSLDGAFRALVKKYLKARVLFVENGVKTGVRCEVSGMRAKGLIDGETITDQIWRVVCREVLIEEGYFHKELLLLPGLFVFQNLEIGLLRI